MSERKKPIYLGRLNKDQKTYKFTADPFDFVNIVDSKIFFENGPHKKFKFLANISGEYIESPEEPDRLCGIITKNMQTYEEAIKIADDFPVKKQEWLMNIFSGIKEQGSILYQNDEYLIIPDYTWNGVNIDDIHILCFFKQYRGKYIRCLRELTHEHIGLLQKAQQDVFRVIKEKYNLDSNRFRTYIHYPPTVYILHLHFSLLNNCTLHAHVDKSHLLENVIRNLMCDSDYYKKNMLALLS